MEVLITGSNGLIGAEAVAFYAKLGCNVFGIDNNLREFFFGNSGSTLWIRENLIKEYKNYKHYSCDIRNKEEIFNLLKEIKPNLIIHCAAQPSHDLAARLPLEDFTTNANGTLNLLEATRQHSPEAIFILMSTNKVYGDNPNKIELEELTTRYDYKSKEFKNGINESMSIDNCKHSLFGVSKASADLLAQEYGKYFGLKVGIFRGGCLTGPMHSSVELHGFLSYLIKCIIHKKPYTIYGYKGKQVRDQIHSSDVILAFEEFRKNPKRGEVYNIGGGKDNSISILECIEQIKLLTNIDFNYQYVDLNRSGDHICYYTDLKKFKTDFPNWKVNISTSQIISEIVKFELNKNKITI